MPDPTGAARSRRYRERKAKRLPPAPKVPCQGCPALHAGKYDPWCQRCWLKLTPEGRADLVARVLRSQKRKRDKL